MVQQQLPYWHSVELSAGSRPVLREKEVDVLVENGIGLYQGKSKILQRQNGRIYLTSQRLIYIDNTDAKKLSVSIEHADIDKLDYTQKFLKSSPKITIFFKKLKKNKKRSNNKQQIGDDRNNYQHTHSNRIAPWVCPICSYSNNVNMNLNPNNVQYLPVCETCGVKSTSDLIQQALGSAKSSVKSPLSDPKNGAEDPVINAKVLAPKQIACPTCTFLNHPSLRNCELCGTILPSNEQNDNVQDEFQLFDDRIRIETESSDGLDESVLPFIKISFHKSGDKFFLTKFQETLEKFKWDTVLNSGNANKDARKLVKNDTRESSSDDLKHTDSIGFGIHRLAQQEEYRTKQNEQIINSSLDDLQALLNKANEILQLTESFKQLNSNGNSKDQLPININQVTKSLLHDSNNQSNRKLYLQEISRQLSDFLINDGILEEEGGIITLIDLYALFNRGRVGINLISPDELYKSCEYFPQLQLPLILKKINNVLVVQDLKVGSDSTKIIEDIKKFIDTFGDEDSFQFKYSSILKISDSFNWSLTITEEILKIGLDMGELVVDRQISGKFYYLNEFIQMDNFKEVSLELNTGNLDYDSLIQPPQSGNQKETTPLHVLEMENDVEELKHELQLPDAPSNQPFPEVPSHFGQNTESKSHESNLKSKTLSQLEGLQF